MERKRQQRQKIPPKSRALERALQRKIVDCKGRKIQFPPCCKAAADSQPSKKKSLEKQKQFEQEKKKLEMRVERTASKTLNKQDGDKTKSEYIKRLEYLSKYGKNFYCPTMKKRTGLKPIYIDGSNVAFSHGQNERFSVEGLKICIDYFRKRGHEVKAFVPNFRLRNNECSNPILLRKLVQMKLVIVTPTLYIRAQRRSPYDDWYIVQSAAANGGIIVSADNFTDVIQWNPNLRHIVEESRLVPTFVDDMIIFPVDPHGNRQNNLEEFLKYP